MGEKGLGTDPGVVGAGAAEAGVIGGAVPGGAIISARGAGGLGSSSPTGSSANRGTGEDTWEPSAGARQTPKRDFGDRMEGLGTDTGVVGTGVPDPSAGVGDASSGAGGRAIIRSIPTPSGGGTGGTLDRKPGDSSPMGGPGIVGTGAPDPGVVAADVSTDEWADRPTADDTWEPGAGGGDASSDAGRLGGKSGTLNVSATPGGTAVGRGIGSPMGGSADRGTGAPDPGVVAADLNADGAADRTGNVQYRESSLE